MPNHSPEHTSKRGKLAVPKTTLTHLRCRHGHGNLKAIQSDPSLSFVEAKRLLFGGARPPKEALAIMISYVPQTNCNWFPNPSSELPDEPPPDSFGDLDLQRRIGELTAQHLNKRVKALVAHLAREPTKPTHAKKPPAATAKGASEGGPSKRRPLQDLNCPSPESPPRCGGNRTPPCPCNIPILLRLDCSPPQAPATKTPCRYGASCYRRNPVR